MRAEIIKLRQRIDTIFVYVTHDQTEAMTLGDRIVIMRNGFIHQIGTPQEVFDHPANLFVAGFIGTPQMNLFDALYTILRLIMAVCYSNFWKLMDWHKNDVVPVFSVGTMVILSVILLNYNNCYDLHNVYDFPVAVIVMTTEL